MIVNSCENKHKCIRYARFIYDWCKYNFSEKLRTLYTTRIMSLLRHKDYLLNRHTLTLLLLVDYYISRGWLIL